MSDVSQGPDWWQAADLKWYPPELHADYVPPLPPPPKLPPPPNLPPPPKLPPPPRDDVAEASGQAAGTHDASPAFPAVPAGPAVARDKVRRFWSGLSDAGKVTVVVVGLLVVAAGVAVPVIAIDYVFGGGSSHSPSYQAGYDAGSRGGLARNTANINVGGVVGSPYSVNTACDMAEGIAAMLPKQAPGYVSDFNSADFMQGCIAAFHDHPVTSQAPSGQ
jgi:hypothetical protein